MWQQWILQPMQNFPGYSQVIWQHHSARTLWIRSAGAKPEQLPSPNSTYTEVHITEKETVLMVFKNFTSILNNKYLEFCIMVSILKEPEVLHVYELVTPNFRLRRGINILSFTLACDAGCRVVTSDSQQRPEKYFYLSSQHLQPSREKKTSPGLQAQTTAPGTQGGWIWQCALCMYSAALVITGKVSRCSRCFIAV